MDSLSKSERSKLMSKIKGKDTTPERVVRSWLHGLGFRFRLHRKDLPGKPDIVLPKYKVVILVNGCFWHQHPGCKVARVPESNREFWERKFRKNTENDVKTMAALEALGWRVLVLWECEVKGKVFQDKVLSFLSETPQQSKSI